MIIKIVLLLIGFVVLIKGADFFVDGASNVARNFKVSKILIGLTIVAFGTSSPELAVSIKSMLSNNGDIVLGNVIGSNILNILLIIGISSLIHDLNVKNNTVKKELPITILLTSLLVLLMNDKLISHKANTLDRIDGITLILFFLVFVYYLISLVIHRKDNNDNETIYKLPKSILITIFGLIAIIIGSNTVVDNAVKIARILNVSERVIGLSLIALGTSLPELVTSIIATKKKEYEIAVGNVIGSNIFNIGIVLGIPLTIFGEIKIISFNYFDQIVLLISTLLLFIFSINDYKIKKLEGIILLTIFIIYYLYILF